MRPKDSSAATGPHVQTRTAFSDLMIQVLILSYLNHYIEVQALKWLTGEKSISHYMYLEEINRKYRQDYVTIWNQYRRNSGPKLRREKLSEPVPNPALHRCSERETAVSAWLHTQPASGSAAEPQTLPRTSSFRLWSLVPRKMGKVTRTGSSKTTILNYCKHTKILHLENEGNVQPAHTAPLSRSLGLRVFGDSHEIVTSRIRDIITCLEEIPLTTSRKTQH